MSNEDIYFLKGNENIVKSKKLGEGKNPVDLIKEQFSKILEIKNFSFLLGSGCSSFEVQGEQVGIPTMKALANEFFSINESQADDFSLKKDDKTWLREEIKLDVETKPLSTNIEKFLGALTSIKFYNDISNVDCEVKEKHDRIERIIRETNQFLLKKCLNQVNKNKGKDDSLIKIYENFLKKLLYRSSNLPKPNIFTTNYDLYPETALDRLGIYYVNGFSGGIKKYFNPTIFNYALAEKMDLSENKWNVIDNFFYLYKLHGSVNWIEDNEPSKLFKVRELQEVTFNHLSEQERIMIYPTPLKHNASLGSPYSDLFREFQKCLMKSNNVLIVIGYSFSDEHINNLIYQAFTIPSFRLIVFGNSKQNKELQKLKSLDDPRIWIIGGKTEEGEKLHYFKNVVQDVFPDLSNDELEDKIENAIKVLSNNE